MAVKAIVNPKILIWARETANMSLEEAAKAPSVDAEKLQSWESGEDFPTLNQAKKLAKKYRRAFSLFYLDEIPEDFEPIKDFRKGRIEFSTGLVYFIREVSEKRNWLRDVMLSNGEPPKEFVGSFSVNSSIEIVAQAISDQLKINDRLSSSNPYLFVVRQCEDMGINVLRSGSYHSHLPVDVEEVRGFALADEYAPFVFINSRDSDAANLFTLVHELAHIWIKETGISNLEEIDFREPVPASGVERVEVFCNKIAAEVLMPLQMIKEAFSGLVIGSKDYESTRKKFGVSKLALAIRQANVGMISEPEFNKWKVEYNANVRFAQANPKKKSGGGDFYRTKAVRNGKMFSNIVINMYHVGLLNGGSASSLLGIKMNQLRRYQTYVT